MKAKKKNKLTPRSYKQNKTTTTYIRTCQVKWLSTWLICICFTGCLWNLQGYLTISLRHHRKKKNMLASALHVPTVPKLHPHGIMYSFRSLTFQNKKTKGREVWRCMGDKVFPSWFHFQVSAARPGTRVIVNLSGMIQEMKVPGHPWVSDGHTLL